MEVSRSLLLYCDFVLYLFTIAEADQQHKIPGGKPLLRVSLYN